MSVNLDTRRSVTGEVISKKHFSPSESLFEIINDYSKKKVDRFAHGAFTATLGLSLAAGFHAINDLCLSNKNMNYCMFYKISSIACLAMGIAVVGKMAQEYFFPSKPDRENDEIAKILNQLIIIPRKNKE